MFRRLGYKLRYHEQAQRKLLELDVQINSRLALIALQDPDYSNGLEDSEFQETPCEFLDSGGLLEKS